MLGGFGEPAWAPMIPSIVPPLKNNVSSNGKRQRSASSYLPIALQSPVPARRRHRDGRHNSSAQRAGTLGQYQVPLREERSEIKSTLFLIACSHQVRRRRNPRRPSHKLTILHFAAPWTATNSAIISWPLSSSFPFPNPTLVLIKCLLANRHLQDPTVEEV
jgi:hypothetical protein